MRASGRISRGGATDQRDVVSHGRTIEGELVGAFDVLTVGGEVRAPLGRQFRGDTHG